ncbi:MAG TPA: glycosyltransferase family 4 protein [Pyrinomonadaceae bacterium]|nr:glycosyltransferase family 4 protein [Pyrinomonadaceae bacterium]
MKLLFVTPFFRVPPDFGSGIRNYQVLDHLTSSHEVTVITYGEDETGKTDSWLTARGAKVLRLPYALPWSNGSGRLTALRNLFYYPPASFQRFSPQVLSDAVSRCLEEAPDIDLILFDTALAGQAVLNKKFNRPHVMIVLDIYSVLLRREFEVTAWRPHKLVRLFDWIKTRHYEGRVLGSYENLIAVSGADEVYLTTHFKRARTFVVPNGVDTDKFSRNGQRRDPNTILFVGAFEYAPNVDAFFYFCREILPQVRARRPETRFVAVGRHPTEEMSEYAKANSGISLTGTVDDVRPYYGLTTLAVVPLRVGSGMKLKTLEAFGMGVPVISTSIGCEGLEVENGVHCAVADTPQAFSEGILDLLSRPDHARELAQRARKLVTERYDWKQIASRFEATLEQIANSTPGRAAKLGHAREYADQSLG